MSEQLNLTTPIVRPSTTGYKIDSIWLNWGNSTITITLFDPVTGDKPIFVYSGVPAKTMMVAMNKMDFSTISFQKRVLQQLLTDGYLNGTISGTPD
jgi:hypothetical protein